MSLRPRSDRAWFVVATLAMMLGCAFMYMPIFGFVVHQGGSFADHKWHDAIAMENSALLLFIIVAYASRRSNRKLAWYTAAVLAAMGARLLWFGVHLSGHIVTQ